MTNTQKAVGGASLAVAIGAAVLLAPAPSVTPRWPVLRATWNPVQCDGYNFYHGTNLDRRTWVKLGTTTTNVFAFQSEQCGFIGVRSFYRFGTNELESGWNVK